jgi:hypothetical protein
LFDQASASQGFQAIVNGGQGNGRDPLLDLDEQFSRRRVIALLYQNVVYFATLTSQPKIAAQMEGEGQGGRLGSKGRWRRAHHDAL